MTRASKGGSVRIAKRKKILKLAKGSLGRVKNCRKLAKQKVICHKLVYPYIDRKLKKRDFRSLFIKVIGVFARESINSTYSQFMKVFNKSKYFDMLNRKDLAMIIQNDKDKLIAIYNESISSGA